MQCWLYDACEALLIELYIEHVQIDLEYDEEQNVVFSVVGDSSVHLAGYYK
jgi:hypothetical protein